VDVAQPLHDLAYLDYMASQGQLLPRQEMTLYQDVPGDLDLFVRLAKAGHFECTEQFFTEALGGLGNVFAVFTEYVDMLIDQGAFDRAADTVQKILGASVADGNSAFSDEQRTVLNLSLALALTHTQPSEKPAALSAFQGDFRRVATGDLLLDLAEPLKVLLPKVYLDQIADHIGRLKRCCLDIACWS